eukprot:Nk52_evm1s72 gene=Nk52_evmTU1s72
MGKIADSTEQYFNYKNPNSQSSPKNTKKPSKPHSAAASSSPQWSSSDVDPPNQYTDHPPFDPEPPDTAAYYITRGSLAFKKKDSFVWCSLILCVAFLVLCITDYIYTINLEEPGYIVSDWTLSIWIFQVIGIYMALLGFVYSNEAGTHTIWVISILSL